LKEHAYSGPNSSIIARKISFADLTFVVLWDDEAVSIPFGFSFFLSVSFHVSGIDFETVSFQKDSFSS